MFTSLQRDLHLVLARDALQSQHNLLCGLGLLVEDWLGLTTVSLLLSVVTSLSLGKEGVATLLVLGDFVLSVLAALLAFAVRLSGLWDVDHLVSLVARWSGVRYRGAMTC